MNILSFDIEEWYNYSLLKGLKGNYIPELDRVLSKLLDTLESRNIKATFFCLGIMARQNPDVVRKIYSYGHDIGCHSDIHKKLWEFSAKEMKQDTYMALNSLEQLIGKKVVSYRAPAFSINGRNLNFIETLFENGIKYDSSIYPSQRDFGGFPEFPFKHPCIIRSNGVSIKEFPINTAKILNKEVAFSGGGFFRIIPYRMIKKCMGNKEYTMTYLHIHDFNKNQKKILSKRYLKNYYGIKKSFLKFQKFINDYDFMTIGEADIIVNWDKVRIFELN